VSWPGELYTAAVLTRTHVLYSPGDWALKFGFRSGELISPDMSASRAVGLYGDPPLPYQWNYKKPMEHGGKKYGHGDYWKQKETADPVMGFLDPTYPRTLPKSEINSNLMPPPNEIEQAKLPKRCRPSQLLAG
jgi:hypothetical protein